MPEHISGSTRFSVESLLYYAPKITGIGVTLASAVDTAQRRLLDLGNFFGSSWPDEPFRDNYPRCQYAMLIIARQLAEEIQGIGGGIEQTARTYGVAEDQNTADVARIQTSESRMAMLINHTGGLPQPPDTPLSLPTIPTPAGPLPSPQANPAPVAPAAPATQAALSAYITTAPSPEPTPSPEPGADPTAWHLSQSNPLSIMGPWPTGNPAKMDEAADCWTALQGALDTAWTDLQRYTAYILADAQGAAADAFNDYVDGLTATGHGSLTRAIEATQYLHDVCVKQADEIRSLQRSLEETAIELAASIFIGQAVSLLTFESTQALSDALDVGIEARLTELAASFQRFTGIALGDLSGSIKATSSVLGRAFSASFQSAAITDLDIGANDVIGRAFGQPPTPATNALLETLEGGAIGTVLGQGSAGGLLGISAGAASKRLIDLGEALQESDSESPAAKALVQLGVRLKDGSITVSAANAAAAQLITQHKITPVTFFSGTISNRLTTAISPNTGKHAAG
jgi:hypothetical protein